MPKPELRRRLAEEQGFLCAFCMRRVDPTKADENGAPAMRIAHRIPISVDPRRALDWKNLLGSCDGRHSCGRAQGQEALTVDPTDRASIARLRYETRAPWRGLFLTSDDAGVRADVDAREQGGRRVEGVLGLNRGDLPAARQAAWKGFLAAFMKRRPRTYGKPAQREFFQQWRHGTRLREYLGVIESQLEAR
jgi:hypothetical protein